MLSGACPGVFSAFSVSISVGPPAYEKMGTDNEIEKRLCFICKEAPLNLQKIKSKHVFTLRISQCILTVSGDVGNTNCFARLDAL